MVEGRLPYSSLRVVAPKARPAERSFKRTWQEVATRVEAFAVEASNTIRKIQNFPHDLTRQSLTAKVQCLNNHLFILLPGEYVTQADVWFTDKAITALKMYTNKRVTPWYGVCRGTCVALTAKDGDCINAFRGKYGRDGCSELGVIFGPLEMALEGHSLDPKNAIAKQLKLESDEEEDWVGTYRTFDLTPRAVVVTNSDVGIQGVRIVSAAEYDRFVRYPKSFSRNHGEQWFVLVEGERIEAVGVEVQNQTIKAIQFRTNYQTSHVFGVENDAQMQ